MAVRERKHLVLDTDLIDRLEALAKRKGGRRTGTTLSSETNRLVRKALDAEEAKAQEATLTALVQQIVDARMTTLDNHLASMLAKVGVDSATCMMMTARLLAGETVTPEELEEVYQATRHMAVNHFKLKEPGLPGVDGKVTAER